MKWRWIVRGCFSVPFILFLAAWVLSYSFPSDFGRISPHHSWDIRSANGAIDLIEMDYAWPKMQTGWNCEFIEPNHQIDLNFRAENSQFSGIVYKFDAAGAFVSIPLYLPTAISFGSLLVSWRLTRAKDAIPLHRRFASLCKTNGNVSVREIFVRLVLLLVLLLAVAFLVVLLTPSMAK